MSTPQPLAAVVDAFVAEVNQIESVFSSCKGARTVEGFLFPYTPSEDGCLVSVFDAWNRFLRKLVITGASGDVQGLSGAVYQQATPRTESQVLADLSANRKGHNFKIINNEPRWYDLTCLVDIMSFLGLNNSSVVVGSLGSTFVTLGPITVANPIEELRTCRNFVAHKNDFTLRDVQAFSPTAFRDLTTHLRTLRSGVETFSEWRDCLVTLAEAAGQ